MYAEELERRNERLQQALMHFAPGLDIKALMSSGLEPYSLPAPDPSLLITPNPSPINGSPPAKQNELVDTMIEATDRLAIDGRGRCDYLGDFAGLAFLDRISERCCQLLNRNMEKDISSKLFPSQDLSPLCLERHLLATSRTKLLPPKTVATYLTGIAIGDACCLLRFIHQPTFEDQLDRIYDLSPEQYNPEDEAFLGLLYTTLAIGEIFAGKSPGVNEAPENADEPKGYSCAHIFMSCQFTANFSQSGILPSWTSLGQQHRLPRYNVPANPPLHGNLLPIPRPNSTLLLIHLAGCRIRLPNGSAPIQRPQTLRPHPARSTQANLLRPPNHGHLRRHHARAAQEHTRR